MTVAIACGCHVLHGMEFPNCSQVMFSASVPASLYDQLHPPGWCLIPSLEERHWETWARLRHRILENL